MLPVTVWPEVAAADRAAMGPKIHRHSAQVRHPMHGTNAVAKSSREIQNRLRGTMPAAMAVTVLAWTIQCMDLPYHCVIEYSNL